ncbi:MAG: hypothetical protein WC872_01795 [Candidatus Absconditabacterales bacterium]
MSPQSFQNFYFKGFKFDYENLKAEFFYSFDDEVNFTETIDFFCDKFQAKENLDPDIIDNLLFHLSIAIGISYYKLYPTKKLIIESGNLDKDQINFWEKFYINGLGEFFFKNQISPKGLINFQFGKNKNKHKLFKINLNRAIVPIGGGKDSLVTIELLRKTGISFDTFTFGKNYTLHKIVGKKFGGHRLIIKRQIDPQLFDMNKQGYYNGHVPITGIISFVLSVASYLYDYKYIIFSNEKSANEGNTEIDGVQINHQRSKSLDFETDFNQYLSKYISPDLKYFSLLRGMYEIKIAEMFCNYKQYFGLFSSCNTNFKILEDRLLKGNFDNAKRCCVCPKCVFVYTIMRPFLDKKETKLIFGKELFEDAKLLPLFQQLLGIEGIKPFDCVGTNEEVILAMWKSYKNFIKETKSKSELPFILQVFENEVLPHLKESEFTKLENKLLKIYNENNIPIIINAKF